MLTSRSAGSGTLTSPPHPTDMEDAAASELSWMPVLVDSTELLAKAWFGDTHYRVLLSDLHCVWEEEMQAEAIGSRAQVTDRQTTTS